MFTSSPRPLHYPLSRPRRYHHHQPGSSSSSSSSSPSSSSSSPQTATDVEDTPRFSYLLNTVLGSPFLTTSDPPDLPPDVDLVDGALAVVPRSFTVTRPSSPTLAHIIDTFSIISPSEVPDDVFLSSNCPYTFSPAKFTLLTRSLSASVPPMLCSAHVLDGEPLASPLSDRSTTPRQLKSLIPRLWDVLSSPGRNTLSRSQRFVSSVSKGKARAAAMDFSMLNLQDLDPLDGEEGELIDDEACFIDVTVVTGIDILALLPLEVSLYILSNFLDLASILACLAVSRKWRALASDNAVWRCLFVAEAAHDGRGWGINLHRMRNVSVKFKHTTSRGSKLDRSVHPWNRKHVEIGFGGGHNSSPNTIQRSFSTPGSGSRRGLGTISRSRLSHSPEFASPLKVTPLILDWHVLYKERLELDKRWLEGEPEVKILEGHTDSIYCLEFDSTRIITGSRDKTIKVWSLATGRLLGTFRGHSKSVLCLKFDKDWEVDSENSVHKSYRIDGGDASPLESRSKKARGSGRRGFMVSGSSDCTVCVWDLYAEHPSIEGRKSDRRSEGSVRANVRKVLKGHKGGVLDLRIDERWIVSCSKDTFIRVWDRRTLKLHRTFRGHEGPVNSVGLQGEYVQVGAPFPPIYGGRVVSASGDGKMIMWDIETGQRLRTFEGHDRGLACIEFKDDLIVSGSNDRKIKVWSASTGECIRTLLGHDSLVRALSFEPKSGRLVSGSYDRTVKVWDLKKGELIREFKNAHSSHVFDVKFDVGRIISTSHDGKVVVLDFTKGIDSTLFV